jgi:hypothetical protein
MIMKTQSLVEKIKCLCRRNQLLFIQNPAVQPVLLQHFEPWYPLLWTDGGIGAISMGDLNTGELKAFYSGNTDKVSYIEEKKIQTGSNGLLWHLQNSLRKCYFIYQSSHKLLFQT